MLPNLDEAVRVPLRQALLCVDMCGCGSLFRGWPCYPYIISGQSIRPHPSVQTDKPHAHAYIDGPLLEDGIQLLEAQRVELQPVVHERDARRGLGLDLIGGLRRLRRPDDGGQREEQGDDEEEEGRVGGGEQAHGWTGCVVKRVDGDAAGAVGRSQGRPATRERDGPGVLWGEGKLRACELRI